jgi:hypothetical protein
MASRHLQQRIKTLVHTLFARKQTAAGRRTHHCGASRRRSNRWTMGILATQQLEPRLALTVGFLEQPPFGDEERVATVVVSAGDNLYMTKVADASVDGSSAGALRYDMWIDNSSTFLNKQVIKDIDSFDTIAVSSGSQRSETGVRAAGYPVYPGTSDNTTRFVLSRPRLMDYTDSLLNGDFVDWNTGRELRGTLSLTQPDGIESTWSFSNWDQSRPDATTDPRFFLADGRITFTKGPGYGGTMSPTTTTWTTPLTNRRMRSCPLASTSRHRSRSRTIHRLPEFSTSKQHRWRFDGITHCPGTTSRKSPLTTWLRHSLSLVKTLVAPLRRSTSMTKALSPPLPPAMRLFNCLQPSISQVEESSPDRFPV